MFPSASSVAILSSADIDESTLENCVKTALDSLRTAFRPSYLSPDSSRSPGTSVGID